MDNRVTELLKGMSAIYNQQLAFYGELHQMTLLEKAAIEAGDTLSLTEMLRVQDELIIQVKKLEGIQQRMRELLLLELPANRLDMDQLACLAEPEVYMAFRQVLSDLKSLLAKIEEQKTHNVVILGEKMEEVGRELWQLDRAKKTAGAYALRAEGEAAVIDLKQ